jgi:hypothetical protein
VASLGTLAILALIGGQFYQAHEQQRQLRWELEVLRHDRDTDRITLDVGPIQFLSKGYSISLDEVSYGASGVTITGKIGNPYLIEISSLVLVFTVSKPFLTVRDEYLDNPFSVLFSREYNVGSAQVSVGTVEPGSTASFRALIPNVRQSVGEYEITVSFSGERYRYLR